MKNCVSGGGPMTTHLRVSVKQPSQARIKKMLSKKKRKPKLMKKDFGG